MPPLPKHPSARARRNKAATAATLQSDPDLEIPDLPPGDWHPMTARWWADVWSSPMAPEFDDSDTHGLFMLAQIVDDFWMADKPATRKDLAAEIRMQGQRFGLSPMDRRRLQWEIERAEEAQGRTEKRRARSGPTTPSADPAVDPRSVLRAV